MEELLKQIGLTSSEAKVYLALLDLGESKTGDILKKAKLNSGRIYGILSSLEDKGLVSSVIRNKVKLFSPSPPDRILDLLKNEITEIQEKKNSFEKFLPQLNTKFTSIHQNISVEVFYGIDGQKTAYSILFKEADKEKDLFVYGILSKEDYPLDSSKKLFSLLTHYVYKNRRDLKLKTKKLVHENARKEKSYSDDNSTIKYIPFPSLTSMEILGDTTMIQLPIEPFITILINSKQIAEDYKKQFEFLWKIAKK